jgi:hypothetical protein
MANYPLSFLLGFWSDHEMLASTPLYIQALCHGRDMARLIQLWESQASTDLEELNQKINSFDKTTLEKKFVQTLDCGNFEYYITSRYLWDAWERIEELFGWMEVLALRDAWRSENVYFSDFPCPSTMGNFIRITQILPLRLKGKVSLHLS